MAAATGPAAADRADLIGAFAGLIVVIVVAAMFITAEYRRGLIRVTLAASPRRGRVLAAKAVVIGAVTFVAGLAGAAAAVPARRGAAAHNGNYVFPVSALTEVRRGGRDRGAARRRRRPRPGRRRDPAAQRRGGHHR